MSTYGRFWVSPEGKDVSAFANAGGGVIIYGVHESNNIPTGIDVGFDQGEISKEWLEQVINSRIQRRIDGIRINPVLLKDRPERVIFAVAIPQSNRAPHMAFDKKFYKRFVQSVAMEEYEVRDVARRGEAPDLRIDFELDSGSIPSGLPILNLKALISNDAAEPAFYGVIRLFFGISIKLLEIQELTHIPGTHQEVVLGQPRHFNVLQRIWSAQSGLPIWLGQPLPVSAKGVTFGKPSFESDYVIGWQVTSPKMAVKKRFYRFDYNGLVPLS